MAIRLATTRLLPGEQNDDVARVHAALARLDAALPAEEVDRATFGPGTAAAVRGVQAASGLPATGVVDRATVAAIDELLDAQLLNPRVLRGAVRGFVLAGTKVAVFHQRPGGEDLLAESPVNPDGTYELRYAPPAGGGSVDLRVAVLDRAGALVATVPSGDNLLSDAGRVELVDFEIPSEHEPPSAFNRLIVALLPFVGERPIEELGEVELVQLADRSGLPLEQLTALVLAHRLAREGATSGQNTPAELLYGLLREGLPADARALSATHPEVRSGALRAAVARGVVARKVGGRPVEEHLATLDAPLAPALGAALGVELAEGEGEALAGHLRRDASDPDAFWAAVAADPALAGRAARLLHLSQVSNLAGDHAMKAAILAMPDVGEAADLTRRTREEWRAIARTTGAPEGTPGETAEARADAYADGIFAQVEAAFPSRALAARLGADTPVGGLLQRVALERRHPEQVFAAEGQDLDPAEREQVRAFKRLGQVTGARPAEIQALAAADLGSASQIAAIDPEIFAKQHARTLGTDRAAEVHAQARRVSAVAMAVQADLGAGTNRIGMAAVPAPDPAAQAAAAGQAVPDWRELFGGFDLCACGACGSAHGPAAYLVDLLHFLGQRKVADGAEQAALDVLLARRPDLRDVELTCENTNIVLPTIDLVNEILENAVAPPPPFQPFALRQSLQAELELPVASPGLIEAFSPPLAPGSAVETVERGRRWRIHDEPYTYSVVQEGGLRVFARSLQSRGSAEERRARPQYRNRAATAELGAAVFPLSLPFDLPLEEARVYLTHLGVARAALIEALRTDPSHVDPEARATIRAAAERLGLSQAERQIVVGAPLTPPRAPAELWGFAPEVDLADRTELLANVAELLARTGLSYAELEALVATRFVNPTGQMRITGVPVDTCDVEKLRVSDVTPGVLDRIGRFVRLWRKVGWTMVELDKALRAFSARPAEPAIHDRTLVRLDQAGLVVARLGVSVVQALALWGPIDTAEPDSVYARLFQDPAVFQTPVADLALATDGHELARTDRKLADQADALRAALRLDADGLARLIAITNGHLDLANLSRLYRHALLARRTGLTVRDLLTLIALSGLDPFRAPEATLQFVDLVETVRDAGFHVSDLDYLLRRRADQASTVAPLESKLLASLTEIRASALAVDQADLVERDKLRASAVIDKAAAALDLPADMTADLLARVSRGGADGLRLLLALAEIPDTALPLTRASVGAAAELLEDLLGIARIVRTLELPGSLLGWLFRETSGTRGSWLAAEDRPRSVPLAQWLPLVQLPRLRRALEVEDAALEAILEGMEGVALAEGQAALSAARETLLQVLVAWKGWSRADLEVLLGRPDSRSDTGLLHARLTDGYRGLNLLFRLDGAMRLLGRLGVGAAVASRWCESTVSEADARAIREAAKARHDGPGWLGVVGPLEDALRERRRDALVAFLLTRPGLWNPDIDPPDADDLYAHFLIDASTGACQRGSRIQAAMASVQLYGQRCLLGLERGVETRESRWLQWDWMKSFRVWEANRKIWLYPENFVEPELRDDKTPFFRELEDELLQTDLDDAAAEQALRGYLGKLDEVARLEIAGTYVDEDRTLHVVGRTWHTPRVYYYRCRDGATLGWTPWEKVDVDIEGDHLVPVVWNRRLMLIWLVFNKQAEQNDLRMPGAGEDMPPARLFWELQLAWSEYQQGRWSAKVLSQAVKVKVQDPVPDGVLFDTLVQALASEGARGAPAAFAAKRRIEVEPEPEVDPTPPPPRPGVSSPPKGPNASPAAAQTLVGKDLVVLKAFAFDDDLLVRVYLRRDYRANKARGDERIACVLGEFRLFGCRRLVTTANHAQVSGARRARNFPLAPPSTRFDGMWFLGVDDGLVLFDGALPLFKDRASRDVVDPALREQLGPSIAGDPDTTNKQDIPVLGATPTGYKLLAPHQDLQFVGDHPSFFMDGTRNFLITSRRSPFPRLTDWVRGNVATAARPPAPPSRPRAARAVTVLARSANGQRTAVQVVPPRLESSFEPTSPLPVYGTPRRYRFSNFHHPFLCAFLSALDRGGLDGLFAPSLQRPERKPTFDQYAPRAVVEGDRPIDEVEFQAGGPYQIYNWELFFHVPLLIATRLHANQRFKEAQRWFHFIFDPTGPADGDTPQRFWRFGPFHERSRADAEAESAKAIEDLVAHGAPPDLLVAVEAWRKDPFRPHAIARLRLSAYQKAVVMSYIDNLIDWGDHLFRQQTREAIDEATQLYVLAGEILGRRPEILSRDLRSEVRTFGTLTLQAGGLSNALSRIEVLISDLGETGLAADDPRAPDPPSPTTLLFCVPENTQLLSYWDTVADRLFKIRHCQSIAGQALDLPLFAPPIDPALLVRARAAGLSIADVLQDLDAARISLPNYRFSFMLQKASELTSEVRNLGNALLSVLEKRDAEALSTLRSGQELRMAELVRDIRSKQVDEATASLEALRRSRDSAQARKEYYESREFISSGEASALALSTLSNLYQLEGQVTRLSAPPLQSSGRIVIAGFTVGSVVGPADQGESAKSAAGIFDALAGVASGVSQIVGRLGEFRRRQDDWNHQANLATIEIEQLDQQILSAEIRLAMAQRELRNHDQQITHAREVDRFLRDKYTNRDLYQYMIARVSGLYFQSYQLAYEQARRAERCMQHELGREVDTPPIIRFGYWDTLKKGLLAGDHLAQDLRRLDIAYLDANVREYELTKHISLASLAPELLLRFKEKGACELEIPEWLYDLDTPGHFMRRIRSVSLTVPCVTGPYTTIHCRLDLLKSRYRRNTDTDGGYERREPTDELSGADPRFIEVQSGDQAMVTSTGQADAGLFDPNLRDERYLPFEGAGAESRWRITLPAAFKTFDPRTISDVILHVRYTARDGREALAVPATEAVRSLLRGDRGPQLARIFNLRQEFPSEWHRLLSAAPAPSGNHVMTVDLAEARFPFFAQGRRITVQRAEVNLVIDGAPDRRGAIAPGSGEPEAARNPWPGAGSAEEGQPGVWTFGTGVDPKRIEDVYVVVRYVIA